MSNSGSFQRGPGASADAERGARQQQGSRPTPGKVTRTSKLRPVQAKRGGADGGAAAAGAGGGGAAGGGGGLPGGLKTGIESLSGVSMDGVKVHYNSPRPAHVGALAYAQGSDIHVGPGQEQHLPHEAWHVVQQAQGRVASTTQMKGVELNDDAGLEREADVMGAKALAMGGSEAAATSAGPAASGPVQAVRNPDFGGVVVQRFGSLEHKTLGDRPTGSAEYDMGGHTAESDADAYNAAFRLTHGDIIMLSGDFFSPRDTRMNEQGVEEPDPDSLFRIAGTPSRSPGQTVGSWDEVVYAIKKAMPNDDRFQPASLPGFPDGHPWASVRFSADVMAAVDARYLRRAASNDEHFVAPTGTDRGPTAGDRASAGGSYRALHEVAIQMAYDEGTAATAMAREAAAQHFLTDHFASGHLRTPRTSIRAHWQAIYPLFWDNIRNKIALDVATWINDNENLGYLASVDQIYTDIQTQVVEATADIPPMGFDDLVSLVTHDFDNENGLWVTNDLGESWKLFGDGNLDSADPDNRTREMSELAVSLGNADIEAAAQMGANKGDTPLSAAELFDSVRSITGAPASAGVKYGPEQVLPRLDSARASENGSSNWQQSSMDELWQAQVTSATAATYGSEITASMQGGELQHELAGMAEKFPESQDVMGVFTVRPRQAFLDGFLGPLVANPRTGLQSILDFSPSRGQAGFNEDDAVMREIEGEDGAGGMSDEQLGGLTMNQRAERIRALIGGWTGEDEGEVVIRIFETTPAGDRARLYEMVEGHPWTGNWREGFFVVDDDIWDALYESQLERLRDIIGH
ncbi:eCIS core domain-containing protein [Haliangium ochraceum]|uniref:eCIS core domain-containing protein n=1 Tax=Haliangium ochraceum (strain DSM 14365 / JCM 11303 / SMP-2) TaxID=502025 RepID=D0LFX9_HALO1|nr:DUF4157 domain-containing protein [Haliangium ochraceum]ACY14581.1 hypothetical protein Hoch_2036 [Haliangium ochraceum DSM 14365]